MTITNVLNICLSNHNYLQERYFSKKFPEHYNEVIRISFPKYFTFQQKLFHYLNTDLNLKLIKTCPVCGSETKFVNFNLGYREFCSRKCINNYQKTRDKIFHTKTIKYGNGNYNNRVKYTETCLDRFNCDNPAKNIVIKRKIAESNKNVCLERYNVTNVAKLYNDKPEWFENSINKHKQTCIKLYGVDNYFKSEDFKKRSYQTKKKNNSFHTSKIEEQLKQYLDEKNIPYIYQYTSEQYPFMCDFYFPEKDLYVEIQGTWTHGKKPFTGSEDDLKQLEKWKSKNTKYYKTSIETWTKRDVTKREIAKQNRLNYLEIFSIDLKTCLNEINKYIKIKTNDVYRFV